MASVFFAVILATLMMSLKEGSYQNMTQSMVGSFTGYAQVHAKGYFEERTFEESFILHDSLTERISQEEGVAFFVPRIESFALSASYESTKGVMVVGTDPFSESRLTKLNERLVAGHYLTTEDEAILVGAGLADYHQLTVGDTLVLLGQGYRGATAAGKYPVKGIVKFGSPELSKQLVIMPLALSQTLFRMEGMANNIVLGVKAADEAEAVAASLGKKLGEEYEVMPWPSLLPELMDMIEADKMEAYVFMFILYLLIAFGILGTVVMMLAERQHEFGVLVAIGMKRSMLALVVMIEIVVIAVLGALSGIVGALPVVSYFYFKPIQLGGGEIGEMLEEYGMEAVVSTAIDLEIFLQQAFLVAFLAIIISLYPYFKVLRIKAISAMNS
jgi:ABC-type lipoprotein release transport system permease subunit